MWHRRLLVVLVTGCLSGAVAAALGGREDVGGSRDPYDLERFPRSWIVDYQREAEARSRRFIMGRVDSIRRDLRIGDELNLQAALETVTYQIPEGVSVDAVRDHYLSQFAGDVLFQCAGRGCGRSNDWANQVFNDATLYGPDRNQRYAALEWQGRLAALYVIERGNQRVYAHLRFLEPLGEDAMAPNALLVRRLAERGWAPIDAVRPQADGSLTEPARDILSGLAAALEDFADEPMYLVCHLYASQPADDLLTAAQRCAERAVELIGSDADAAMPQLRPFAAGPLLPRSVPGAARLELVLPQRLAPGR